ncbi:hypothetical protein BXZ70DRAFT_900822 [Cristinia sonorae]|uniref:Mucoidy inhibitor A n=1 Tax=Cristinia sonorae TaxID=1940300 RepID=A0A8K0UFV4_9AGAR|nr:hypothetical protein BXZ70DRAFT_900822 [Cristinia sonorae]
MVASTTSPDPAPPPFPPANTIELVSVKDSKITNVSVYSGRAEITRLFEFTVKAGQNQLNIVGLPQALEWESLRVEGRGTATIHDVSISTIIPPPIPTTSPTLTSLLAQQKKIDNALSRVKKSLSSLETYVSSVRAEHLDVSKLRDVVGSYEATAGDLDEKVTRLEDEKKEAEEAIKAEREKLSGPKGNDKLNVKATIGIFAEAKGEVKIALVYAVHDASWSAAYDIRVDMQTKDKPVTLVYKGSITQSTGEDWEDVPLLLETATPTFGVGLPTLDRWTLHKHRPVVYGQNHQASMRATMMGGGPPMAAPPAAPMRKAMAMSRAMSDDTAESVGFRELTVSSKGNISATFAVPGLMSIPSDGTGHNVTIATLAMDATMSWVCIPKKDTRVHLNAKIKNASEYTLLPATASVYVDGSFISRSEVPQVSPEEHFDCPLGLDSSVRITYHPRTKKTSQSGFYNKSSNHSFAQRVTVHNTKSSSPIKVKIIDQIPITEDSSINVKLIQPALVLPETEGTNGTMSKVASGSEGKARLPAPVRVASGVVATWDGADEISLGSVSQEDVDVEALGKDGRFCWVCDIAPQGKTNLALQWEVSAPLRATVYGL